ncbi:MAG TPA: 2-dehydropantoate 2-reductase, partial [Gaiellales bacterium]|nr:2-dehydropantoate 2-reductase [Gaiellales bacterium]
MRFAVLGAGAIGAYLGATLAQAGSDVTLIARGPHLQAMIDHGVRVQSQRGDFTSHPAATADIDALAEADVIVIGLKAHSLPELAPAIGERLRPDAVVVPAQNGLPWWYFQGQDGPLAGCTLESVDPGGVISRSIATERIVGCVVYCSTEIVEPGVIRHIEGTRFTIGRPDGVATERCGEISRALVAAGLKCSFDQQLRRQIWLKLVGNAAFNPITTLTRSTMGALRGSERALAYVRTVMEECAAVAASVGVELPISIDRRLEAGLAV